MITEETYAWVEELLNEKVTEISDEDYNRLVEQYFRRDKADWYKNNTNQKRWDELKVANFWKLIHKFIIPLGEKRKLFSFEKFIFPKSSYFFNYTDFPFDNNYFFDKNKIYWTFNGEVVFKNTKFLDNLFFHKIIFNGDVKLKNVELNNLNIFQSKFRKKVIFEDCHIKNIEFYETDFSHDFVLNNNIFNETFSARNIEFRREVHFTNNIFNKEVNFSDINFHKNTSFLNSNFLGSTLISECKFINNVDFKDTHFLSNSDFINIHFLYNVTFYKSIFKEKTNFNFIIIRNKINFSQTTFEQVNFQEISNKIIDKDDNPSPKIYLKDIFFNTNTSFRNINLLELDLTNCDMTNIIFSRCNWGESQNRLKLANEQFKGHVNLKNIIFKLKDSENHYRQLKKNFYNSKNWELSGKAYISEMEMRKLRLKLEKKRYQWFIYKFYDVFGGYTQDFRKPIVSLVGLILVFSVIYFFIDYNILKALQRGIKGALPYMEIDTKSPFEGYWLIPRNLEFVLGGTFLAFFILALRKRFKQ